MRKKNRIITLTTDFGLRDPYVAEIKGVIFNISPRVKVVDITHQVEKFDIQRAGYILSAASPYFSEGTIHVVVVDPGVGTKRKAILIETKKSYFIGPDNGVLALAAGNQGIESIYKIERTKVIRSEVSDTFHGRDIFAPTAAHLANGTPPSEVGPEISRLIIPNFSKTTKKDDRLIGTILYVDSFGNIVTNLHKKDLEEIGIKKKVNLKLNSDTLQLKICKSYAEMEIGKPLAIIGSHNFLEISLNQGNAARRFQTKVGDTIIVYR